MTKPDQEIETPFSDDDPSEYTLNTLEDGTRTASNCLHDIIVAPDGESKIFKRRAIRLNAAKGNRFDTALVCELNGVRIYIRGSQIVMTTQDLKL